MAAAATDSNTGKRYAVVTGSNKGIGYEICRQLASHGITVVLTARDEKRGLDALEKLKGSGFSENVHFHQLDVANSASVASLAEFIKTQFGRLDILVNNAAIVGTIIDSDALQASLTAAGEKGGAQINWNGILTETYEMAVECFQINYHGTKRMIEAFIPLLQLTQSPRIVNVSSSLGKLKNVPNAWAEGILKDEKNLTEERVEEVINEFLKDLKEGSLAANGWPLSWSTYTVSKAAVNAYTRTMAKKYTNLKVNCVCPGYCKTDLNHNTGILTVEEGAESPVRAALLPDDGPSGLFFDRNGVSSFE